MNKPRVQRLAAAGSFFAVLLLLWQLASDKNWVDPSLIPSPVRIAVAIGEWARSGNLWTDCTASLWRDLLGLTIGSTLGIVFGLFTGRNKLTNELLGPLLNLFKAFPPVAMLPVFITFWGIGDLSKVIAISFGTLFPVWVNTHVGAGSVPKEYIRSARLLTSSRSRIFFRVVLPASLQSILAGLRISIAMSFIMLYVSELAGASNGIGYRIISAQLAYRMDLMFGALIVLGLAALLVDYLFHLVINFWLPWLRLSKTV